MKVTAKIWLGYAFLEYIICAIRAVKALVFPVPAPASIKTGPSIMVTPSLWRSLSPSRYFGFNPARACCASPVESGECSGP